MKGIGVSPGISIGRARLIIRKNKTIIEISPNSSADVFREVARFGDAVQQSVQDIEILLRNNTKSLLKEELEILETQIEFLNDPKLKEDVELKIREELKPVTIALSEVIQNLVVMFEQMDDEYLSSKAEDFKDIGNRLMKHLNGESTNQLQNLDENTILIADDFSPSETISLDVSRVAGFVTRLGGKTSHTAIIAKTKGIPAIVGCGESLSSVCDKDVIIFDGQTGLIWINPEESIIQEYTVLQERYRKQSDWLKTLKEIPATTTDGFRISLKANISSADEIESVFENGGEGVGLLRTELLFMDHDSFPTEEEQFEFYKKIAGKSRQKPVVVRTIDIGGDKSLPYFNLPVESNPFLGYRGIRICLDRSELFQTQLRAILRASNFGKLKVMFPMISSLQELRAAKIHLETVKKQLTDENISFDRDIQVGIMIEVPSAAVIADLLAREVDFFSIGTNDLCQYTLAVDRMNEQVSHLYDPYHPAVLRLIHQVIQQAHQNRIEVSLCGELAGDPQSTLLLMGFGLTEFSMGASSIPIIKNIIINTILEKACEVAKKVLLMEDSEQIKTFLEQINQ